MNNIVHIEIGVTDLDKAKEFYASIFNWKIYADDNLLDYLIFEIDSEGDHVGGGLNLVDEQPNPGSVKLYVNVEDIDQHLQDIVNAGGKIILQKTRVGGEHGYIGQFEDPFGNIMGIWSDN